MNTDASNVEYINIHHIMESLSMSYGSASFASDHVLCSGMNVILEKRSDSVAVSESISISMTNSLDTGFTELVFDISPDFRT